MGPGECLGRQGRNVSYQQVAATEFGFDQVLGITAANQCELLAKPIDDDVDRAVADRVLRTIKQFPDFTARTEGPGLRYKVRQQAALRTRQVRGWSRTWRVRSGT